MIFKVVTEMSILIPNNFLHEYNARVNSLKRLYFPDFFAKIYFQNFFAKNCGHVTKLQPMSSNWKCFVILPGNFIKKEGFWVFSSFKLL